MKMQNVVLLLVFSVVGTQALDLRALASRPCSEITERDVCIVSAEQDGTCGWCVSKGHSFCLNRPAVAFLTNKNSKVECGFGDEEVLTRMPQSGDTSRTPQLGAGDADYIPVVFMHGIGDSGHNPGMQSIAKSVTTAYPGTYSIAVDVADGLSGYTEDILKQVQDFAATVKADPKLSRGFTAVGLSQGGLIVRVYVELFNDPPVHNLISLCGPQEGVGECPGGTPSFICNLVRDRMYEAPVSFAGYWKNVLDKDTYISNNRHLVYWNNEKSPNTTFARNLKSLNKLVLVQALNDTVVEPHISEDFGFFSWGSEDTLVAFNETAEYASDVIGLKSLDNEGRLFHHAYVGNHLRWSREFWEDTVLPYFNSTFSERAPLHPRGIQPRF